MSLRLTRQFRRTGGTIGLVMAVFALASHFAWASMIMPDATDPVALAQADSLTILCNGAVPQHQHDRAPHPGSGRECLLCPLSVSTLQAILVGAGPELPTPIILRIGRFVALLRTHAPPRRLALTPFPTGPPTLV